jgi:hypothetical protein
MGSVKTRFRLWDRFLRILCPFTRMFVTLNRRPAYAKPWRFPLPPLEMFISPVLWRWDNRSGWRTFRKNEKISPYSRLWSIRCSPGESSGTLDEIRKVSEFTTGSGQSRKIFLPNWTHYDPFVGHDAFSALAVFMPMWDMAKMVKGG